MSLGLYIRDLPSGKIRANNIIPKITTAIIIIIVQRIRTYNILYKFSK